MAIAFTLLVFVLSAVLVFAVQRSITDWNVHKGRRLQNVILPQIARVYRQHGRFSEERVHQAVSPFLTSSIYVYIENREGDVVYFFSRGARIAIHDSTQVRQEIESIEGFGDSRVPILDDNEVVGRLYADTFGFTQHMANRALLDTLFTTVISGSAAALLLALAMAVVLSRLVSRKATELSEGLQALADGERDVSFPDAGTSEMRTIAQAARTLQEQLHSEEQLRRRWAQDVAHDLRTPLAALRTQVESMADGIVTADPDRLQSLLDELMRMERLMSGLRELSRIESPEMKLEADRIRTRDFLGELERTFADRAREAGMELVSYADIDHFVADEQLIYRAVGNIVENAIEHGSGPGTIQMRIEHRAPIVRIRITNPGTISAEEKQRMFERLYRGDDARNSAGSGLGLSITRAVTELHGGSLSIDGDISDTWVSVELPEHPKPTT